MRLLEVIKGDHISEETYQAMMEWGKSVGKTCITCKDTPGFVVNRLLGPYSAEAIRMYERGGIFFIVFYICMCGFWLCTIIVLVLTAIIFAFYYF